MERQKTTLAAYNELYKEQGDGYLRLAEGRDRRSKHLVLTERGEALVRRTVDPVMTAETAAMGTLTETEQAQLLALQRRYNAALRQYLPQTGEREKGTERGADR